MILIVKRWWVRYFSDPEAVFLFITILAMLIIFATMGNILVPIVASVIIAHMLSGFVKHLQNLKFPDLLAVLFVYLTFIGVILLFFIWLFPLLFQQLSNLISEIPNILNKGQHFLAQYQAKYPDLFSLDQLKHVVTEFNVYITRVGRFVLSFSIASIGNVITVVVYLILVPLLVFFFLKDRKEIVNWLTKFLPAKRVAITKIWAEVDGKIGDYIRGKIIEIVIVGAVSVAAFLFMGLNYPVLLGVCVGFSVIVPYIGAILVTIPIIVVAMIEWDFGVHFAYLILVYTIIVVLDANVLVPVLFSEKMKLHPVVIILSVLVFGAIWGFWGVFFAIPLATLCNALLKGWPRTTEEKL